MESKLYSSPYGNGSATRKGLKSPAQHMKSLLYILVLILVGFAPVSEVQGQCNIVCNSDLQITLQPGETVDLHYTELLAGLICPGHIYSFTQNPRDTFLHIVGDSTQSIIFAITDLTDNNTCWGVINLFVCDPDDPSTKISCRSQLILSIDTFLNAPFRVWASDLNDNSYINCNSDNLIFRITWADSSDQMTPPATEFIDLDKDNLGANELEMWVGDGMGNWAYCNSTILVNIRNPNFSDKGFSGQVFADADGDCNFSNGDTPLPNWTVVAKGLPSGIETVTTTDSAGYYQLLFFSNRVDTAAEVRVLSGIHYNTQCAPSFQFSFTPGVTEYFTQDLPVEISAPCPQLAVNIGAPFLRRCFSSYYFVHYCNYGLQDAYNAFVEVTLDPFLTYQNSNLPYTSVQGNTYTFFLDTVASGDCNQFWIQVKTSCDAVLGQTHCSTAHIYPDSSCFESNPLWSGANLEVEGICDGDSIRLIIRNTGTGNMPEGSNFIIVEDIIMYRNGQVQLQKDDYREFVMEANGATWTLQVDQVPYHPSPNIPIISLEGCGTNIQGDFSTGIVNQFTQGDRADFLDIDCQSNRGAFDPNDKQAFPKGYGSQHFIDPGTPLEYMIRFQNTGTDTAFTVRIEDALSPHLDKETVRPGASSHPYTFSMSKDGLMEFLFQDILLPDSNTNEPASHGFVRFKVAQKEDIPLGTEIFNEADIYFDFNAPIRTNQVFHTVGSQFITVRVESTFGEHEHLLVYPNPFSESATLEMKGQIRGWELEVFDAFGKLVKRMESPSERLTLDASDWNPGIYWFRILDEKGKSLASGTMVKQH